MRLRIALVLVLAAATPAAAQSIADQLNRPQPAAAGLPAQNLSFFRCFCTASPGAPLANQLTFAPPVAREWNGSVYATSARDASFKAQHSCTAERRGSLFDCINCRCDR
jgi:hypothetical protein